MSESKTYLELSEGSGGANKFYEVTVKGKKVTVRYGRIGASGTTSEESLATPADAAALAAKKIAEKQKKGYAPAVVGAPAKAPAAAPLKPKKKPAAKKARSSRASGSSRQTSAPLLWSFASGQGYAVGLSIDKDLCWIGNQQGKVFALSHDGEVLHSFQLPKDVQSIVADDVWRYAGCCDGYVYDISGRVPRQVYAIGNNLQLNWMDISDGRLVVSDEKSAVSAFDPEGEPMWKKKSSGSFGWMVRADDAGVYHGHSTGVTAYDWRGRLVWERPTAGACQFGWQEADVVYSAGGDGKVYSFSKSGEPGVIYECDSFIASCAAAPGGEYVFACDNRSAIYCFDKAGKRLWKLLSGCGVAGSMQYFEGRLYVATWSAHLGCIDVSEAAIQVAAAGKSLAAPRQIQAPAIKREAEALATTKSAGKGVIVECYREGQRLRVRVASPGYEAGWHCQFPRDLREEGARYVVAEVKAARGGSFYRTVGEIKRLVK